MKPIDFVEKHGIKCFTDKKGKRIQFRLLSDDNLVFAGDFIGVIPEGNNLPLIDGFLVELPQFYIYFYYEDPIDGRRIPAKVSLLLIDSMEDILFT